MAGLNLPQIKILSEEGLLISFSTPACPACGATETFVQHRNNVAAYLNQGAFVQDAFPDFTPEQRERIINGTHSDCTATPEEQTAGYLKALKQMFG